jgi:hypothetical protein
VTAAPVCVSVAFQICVTVCEPGHEYPTFQPLIALPPAVTVKPSWKPPLHELLTDQVAVQPPEVPEALAEGEEDGEELGEADGDEDALAEALGEAECDKLGLADGEPEGEEPLPLVSTTTDSAGMVSDPPENVLCAIVGFAAL